MTEVSLPNSAIEIAAAVRKGEVQAVDVLEAALARIYAQNSVINAFTDITKDRARVEASAIDAMVAQGADPGPLAGVPYAVKNLFDLQGVVTRAGSKINRDNPPAATDADLVARLSDAGAVCLGALNMGEFAYDFTGENVHDGNCCNPLDPTRMTGGSSSGSGAAVAAGMVPIALGSDTNGSLRVPASLCGVYSLRPTYGRLSRGGSFPFVDSLDTVGPIAQNLNDLALVYDALQGYSNRDHACRNLPKAPTAQTIDNSRKGMRVGVLRGWFEENSGGDALACRDQFLAAVEEDAEIVDINLDQAEIGRAAAYLITHAESSALHLDSLRCRSADYDPDTRDRFLAGTMLPAAWAQKAQQVRKWWLEKIMQAFSDVDLLVTPATPFSAPKLGQKTLMLNGRERPLRPFLGLLAQPFSCVGLPVVTVPVVRPNALPIGVQIVAPPWKETSAFGLSAVFEAALERN